MGQEEEEEDEDEEEEEAQISIQCRCIRIMMQEAVVGWGGAAATCLPIPRTHRQRQHLTSMAAAVVAGVSPLNKAGGVMRTQTHGRTDNHTRMGEREGVGGELD